jgi:hypothetical protein
MIFIIKNNYYSNIIEGYVSRKDLIDKIKEINVLNEQELETFV